MEDLLNKEKRIRYKLSKRHLDSTKTPTMHMLEDKLRTQQLTKLFLRNIDIQINTPLPSTETTKGETRNKYLCF